MNIINYKINLSKDCPKEKKEFIQNYWEFKDSTFLNQPKKIAKMYGMSITDLSRQVQENSSAEFYLHCKQCNSHEKQTATSQTNFKDIIRHARTSFFFSCENCKELSKEELRKENELAFREAIDQSTKAVENKSWNDLTAFQRQVLIDVIEFDNFNKLRSYYQAKTVPMNNFWATLYSLKDYGLIQLSYSDCHRYIKDINFSTEIMNQLPEIKEQNYIKKPKVQFDNGNNELKFLLTSNYNKNNIYDSEYSGVLTFPEEVILRPYIKYVYGVWRKSDGNLYISVIPIENTYNSPKQSSIEHQPRHIREAISDFFEERGQNLDLY